MGDPLTDNLAGAFPEKVVPLEEALGRLRNGSRIFIGTGCGEPQHLIHGLVKDRRLQDILIYQMLAFTLNDYLFDDHFLKRFSLKLFFVSYPMRQAANEGRIDYIPAYLSEIPAFFRKDQIRLDAALVQVTPPDRFGYCSLGVSVDVTREAVRQAKLVIAQVNPRMPRTLGDSFVHVGDLDCLVPFEEDLVESNPTAPQSVVTQRIAHYVSELIDDGNTLQVGYGNLPYAILHYLDHKNDLGVHTHMITDAFIPLFKKGVITNRRKSLLTDRAVAAFCIGSQSTYDFLDDNPCFFFAPADFVNNPGVVARNDNFVSISSALEVDLTGQVCSDSIGRMFFSGTGDQANFIRGAALSKGGLSIIALPSTAKKGTVSRITANLSAGAGLATLRADVNFVVTEYGIAQLKGKSIYQRAVELAQIAHPDFRESLIESAKGNHLIFADQLPPPAEDLMFIEEYKSRLELANGRVMSVRPLLPSDEIAYRNFFYSLEKETIYSRFFQHISVFSRKMAQRHWANLDYRRSISLIGLVRHKSNQEVMAIGTYVGEDDPRAEVAFVVREDFHGQGVASYLLAQLETIAIANGYQGFVASVLPQNRGMLRVFEKRYPQAVFKAGSGETQVIMDFPGASGQAPS